MLHSNVAELLLLLNTFTHVWSSGGQAILSLKIKDSLVWDKLDLQLGSAGDRRRGASEAGGTVGAEPRNHQAEKHPRSRHLLPARWNKGPVAWARDRSCMFVGSTRSKDARDAHRRQE